MRISWSLGSWLPVLRRLSGRGVALTIDDAPNKDTTPKLLDLLKDHGAMATFFVSGIRAVDHPKILKRMVAEGHQVYAHGWEHIRLDRAGMERLVGDMEKCETLLRPLRPTPEPYLVRLPYNGGYRNPAVHRALRAWRPGCQIAHWGVSLEDHAIGPRCRSEGDVKRQCSQAVAAVLNHLPGTILLMHDKPFDVETDFGAEVTVTLMAKLLKALDGRGLKTVAIEPCACQSLPSKFMLN